MSVSPSVMYHSMRRTQRSLRRSVEYWTWSQSFDGDSALVMSYFFATEEMSSLHMLYLQPVKALNIGVFPACCKPGEDTVEHRCASCITNIVWLPLSLQTNVLHSIVKSLRSVQGFSTLHTQYWFVIICVKCSHDGCVFEFIKIVWDGQCLHSWIDAVEGLIALAFPRLFFKTKWFFSFLYSSCSQGHRVFVNCVNLRCEKNEPISVMKCSITYSQFYHRVPQDLNFSISFQSVGSV